MPLPPPGYGFPGGVMRASRYRGDYDDDNESEGEGGPREPTLEQIVKDNPKNITAPIRLGTLLHLNPDQ